MSERRKTIPNLTFKLKDMYVSVKKVEPLDDYILLLTFENGEIRQFDVKPYLETGIFKELKDKRIFNSVRTSFDTIEWENSADLDPEVLYQRSTKVLTPPGSSIVKQL